MIVNGETKEAGYEGTFSRMVSLIKIGMKFGGQVL